jgi:hypothetical protein
MLHFGSMERLAIYGSDAKSALVSAGVPADSLKSSMIGFFLTLVSYFMAKWHTKPKHGSYHPTFRNSIIESPSQVPVP